MRQDMCVHVGFHWIGDGIRRGDSRQHRLSTKVLSAGEEANPRPSLVDYSEAVRSAVLTVSGRLNSSCHPRADIEWDGISISSTRPCPGVQLERSQGFLEAESIINHRLLILPLHIAHAV
jgi:hypothetical protein